MRSDKRIKSMQIIALINQKGRGGKIIYIPIIILQETCFINLYKKENK